MDDSKMYTLTAALCKKVKEEMYALTGDTQKDALAHLQRATCEDYAMRLMSAAWDGGNNMMDGLKAQVAKLEEQLKEAEEARRSLAVKLAGANAELKKERDDRDRIIANRTERAKADAKAALKEIAQGATLTANQMRCLDEYETLMAAAAASEKLDMEEYSTRWRVLTWNVAYRHSKSNRMVLLARENGSFLLTRWDGILSYINLQGEEKSVAPFTHYMTIPKTSLAYLLARYPEETPVEMTERKSRADRCEGCAHRTTKEENPNGCVLPACIKDYAGKRSAATGSKSTNNTNL